MNVDRELLRKFAPRYLIDIEEFERDNPSAEQTDDHVAMFTRWLEWNGIVNYSGVIRDVLYELITCSHEHLTSTDQADTARLAQMLGATK